MDSNHRRLSRRIYSPLHLTALQPTLKIATATRWNNTFVLHWVDVAVAGASGRNRTNNRLITNQLLYHWATLAHIFNSFGALGRNRTTDTGIFSPLLYRLSYQGLKGVTTLSRNGDLEETRTLDLRRDRAAF